MAYATTADMVIRFGETEVLRLSSGDGPLPGSIVEATVARAIADATAIVESYLRRRYQTPLAQPTADIVRAVCILARYDLATGANKEPSEQMTKDRDDVMRWLAKIAAGDVTLEGAAPVNAASGILVTDRARLLTPGNVGVL